MDMLAMTILVQVIYLYCATGPPTVHGPQGRGPTCDTAVQPGNLAHVRPARCLASTVHGAFYALCALTVHKLAHSHGHVL